MNVTRACCANTTQRSKAHFEQYHSAFCMTGQVSSATSANFFCLFLGNSPSHGGRKGVRRKKWQLTQKSATLTCESQNYMELKPVHTQLRKCAFRTYSANTHSDSICTILTSNLRTPTLHVGLKCAQCTSAHLRPNTVHF